MIVAFTDWDVYQNGNPQGASIEEGTPISGLGSLRLEGSLTDPNFINLLPSDSSGIPHGFTKGKLRTLFRIDVLSFDSINEKDFGITCLQDQDNLSGGSGSAYGGVAHAESGGLTFRIVKYTGGLSALPIELASSVVPDGYVVGTDIVALEFEWVADLTTLGGTQLILRRGVGAATDFSNLSDIVEVFEVNSPYISSVGEGLCFVDDEGSESSIVVWDKTESFKYL
jgi:hypothetical protein